MFVFVFAVINCVAKLTYYVLYNTEEQTYSPNKAHMMSCLKLQT